jgi:signal transduction histidine kinase
MVDTGEIIIQVLGVYAEAAKRKGIELSAEVEDSLPPVLADRNHLIQMLTNLVDNALKYTPPGGRVWVAANELAPGSGQFLEIAVGDMGTGIPLEEHERVFERFYRGSNNSPGSTGTGLGLAIVRELMQQHSGEVTLDSRTGEGTVFTLQFPLASSDRAEETSIRPIQIVGELQYAETADS